MTAHFAHLSNSIGGRVLDRSQVAASKESIAKIVAYSDELASTKRVENEARNFLEAREGTNDVSDASVREFLGYGAHGKLATATDPQVSVLQLELRELKGRI